MLYVKRGLLFLPLYFVSNAAAVDTKEPKTAITNAASCPCGYYDAGTKNLFTESTILYFNETTSLPIDGFVVESYENKYERGFTSLYRQGASPSNVRFGNYSSYPSLELLVSPPTPDHLVVGGGIRTSRRDLQYGSFRSLLRSPPEYPGGSALSMHLEYNQTETTDMNLMNTNDPANAWVGMHMQAHREANREIGANYSGLTDNTTSPWNYTEYRIDWTADEITYYIGGNKHRVISQAEDDKLPSVPAPLYLKHWSVGDYETMQGPPAALSIANIRWIRLFFNASTMTDEDHLRFDSRCQRQTVCGMDDTSLRGSSAFSPEAELWWKQAPTEKPKRVPAIVIAALCIALSSFLVLNALLKRIPWDRLSGKRVKHLEEEKVEHVEEKTLQPFDEKQEEAQPPAIIYHPEIMSWDSVAESPKPAFTNPFMGGRPVSRPETSIDSATTFSSGPFSSIDTVESYDDSSGRLRPNTMVAQDPRTAALAALEGSKEPVIRSRRSSSVSILPALKENPQAEVTHPRGSSSVDFALMNFSGEKVMQKRDTGSASNKNWVNPFEVKNSGSFSRQSPNETLHAEAVVNKANGSVSTALENSHEAAVKRRGSGSISAGNAGALAEGLARKPDSGHISFKDRPDSGHISFRDSAPEPVMKKMNNSPLSSALSDTYTGAARSKLRGSISPALGVVNEELAIKKPNQGAFLSIPDSNTTPSDNAGLPRRSSIATGRRDTLAFSEASIESNTDHHIGLLPTKEPINYLAGLLALSSLIITVINFCYTFSPALVNPDAQAHYPSEVWTRRLIAPYLMNPVWLGPFLLTSSRFLISNYLRGGSLLSVAEKVVGRTFRLMVPVVGIALLEYFLMESGASKWLEFLPSITFSTWPFVAVPPNLGHFVSEMLGLVYVIPNALPQIINNYCTNILWTIPVQLQGSWTVLLSVIVIYEIKTPWKRFGYYIFCILNHWYAISWGAFFYFGILLADLEITYQYRKLLYRRPMIYYPVIVLCAVLAIGGLSSDLATQWTGKDHVQMEYGIHPDSVTGLPIAQTSKPQTPPFFVPRLNGLIFAVGTQTFIELSPLTQKAFSIKPLIWLSRHTYTIYLLHGFIFWTLGSWLCIAMAVRGWPYWLNILLVAIACYGVLFLSLPALTPVTEVQGRKSALHLWYFAYEQPAPRRATLFPFPQDMLYLEHSVSSGDKRSSTRKGSIMHRRGTYDLDEPEQTNTRPDSRMSIMHRRGTYELDETEPQSTASDRKMSIMHRRGTYGLDEPERQTPGPNRRVSVMHRRETFDMIDPTSDQAPDRRPSIRHRRAGAPELDDIDTQRSENYRSNRHVSIYEPEESSSAAKRLSIYDRRGTFGNPGSAERASSSAALSGVSPRTTRNFNRLQRRDSAFAPHDMV